MWNFLRYFCLNCLCVLVVMIQRHKLHMPPQQHCVSHTGPAFSLGHISSLHSRTFACSHTAICSPSLPFYLSPPPYTLHGLLLIYRPQRDGRLSWPSWMTHSRRLYFTHKLVTYQQHAEHRLGKVCRPKTDVVIAFVYVTEKVM